MSHLGDLKEVIRELHQAEARYVKSIAHGNGFRESSFGMALQRFDLTGHPKAERIYAWAHDSDEPKGSKQYLTVLHIPPVVSPETAVKATIVVGQKPPSYIVTSVPLPTPGAAEMIQNTHKLYWLAPASAGASFRNLPYGVHDQGRYGTDSQAQIRFGSRQGDESRTRSVLRHHCRRDHLGSAICIWVDDCPLLEIPVRALTPLCDYFRYLCKSLHSRNTAGDELGPDWQVTSSREEVPRANPLLP